MRDHSGRYKLMTAGAGLLMAAVIVLAGSSLPAFAGAPGQAPPAPSGTEPAPQGDGAEGAAGEAQPFAEAWARIGQLFMELIDARISFHMEQRVDALVQERLREPLGALEAKLTQTADTLQARLSESAQSFDQRLTRMNTDFQAALDGQQSRIAVLEEQSGQLRSELQRKEAEVAQLRSQLQSLQRRFWLAIGTAAVALAAALLR